MVICISPFLMYLSYHIATNKVKIKDERVLTVELRQKTLYNICINLRGGYYDGV